MKKYQKRNQSILAFIINKKYFVHNGKLFLPVTVKPYIVGYKFGAFVNTKKQVKKINK
jgi:ribosomal protein S19